MSRSTSNSRFLAVRLRETRNQRDRWALFSALNRDLTHCRNEIASARTTGNRSALVFQVDSMIELLHAADLHDAVVLARAGRLILQTVDPYRLEIVEDLLELLSDIPRYLADRWPEAFSTSDQTMN